MIKFPPAANQPPAASSEATQPLPRPQAKRTPRAVFALAGLVSGSLLFASGCGSTGTSQRRFDPHLQDHYEVAAEAYAEGHLEEAVRQYRRVIRRAWAMDDPLESGNNAYNMAAVMTSMSRISEAKDWLVDARVELYRAGTTSANTWLLEAKIAQNQSCFEEASRLIQRAASSDPPCGGDCGDCLCGPHDPCEESCVAKIPCVGTKYRQHRVKDDCEDTFQVQIHLARSSWFAEQYDLPRARHHFQSACELAQELCDFELQAELQHVAAVIHMAAGEFLQAGMHFDLEAKNLRLAANYREIPHALELAAAAYVQAARPAPASDRLCRVARIWYGRGNMNRSWKYVKDAVELAEASGSTGTQIRLALLVHELHQTIEDEQDRDSGSRLRPQELPAPTTDAEMEMSTTRRLDSQPNLSVEEAPLLMLEGPRSKGGMLSKSF